MNIIPGPGPYGSHITLANLDHRLQAFEHLPSSHMLLNRRVAAIDKALRTHPPPYRTFPGTFPGGKRRKTKKQKKTKKRGNKGKKLTKRNRK